MRPEKHHGSILMNCSLEPRRPFGFRKKEIMLRSNGRKPAVVGKVIGAIILERTKPLKTPQPTRIKVQALFVNSYDYGVRINLS
jgi:hypothetical protein